MTELEKYELNQEKIRHLVQNRYCPVCKKNMLEEYCQPQWAHRIPQTKMNLKKYGAEVIHHIKNRVLVCSLKCNSAVLLSPATHPIEAEELVREIQEDLKK